MNLVRSAAFALFGALCLFACSSDPCSAKSTCSADPDISDDQVQICDALLSTTCATTYRAQLDCVNANRVCTAANLTDATATATKCESQINAELLCESGGQPVFGLLPDGGAIELYPDGGEVFFDPDAGAADAGPVDAGS